MKGILVSHNVLPIFSRHFHFITQTVFIPLIPFRSPYLLLRHG